MPVNGTKCLGRIALLHTYTRSYRSWPVDAGRGGSNLSLVAGLIAGLGQEYSSRTVKQLSR